MLTMTLVAFVSSATYTADPSTLNARLPTLQAGDRLELAAGTYAHFTVRNLNGRADAWIVITGPETGAPAIIEADSGPCCNTVELVDSSYVSLSHLTVDNKGVQGAFAVSAKSGVVHHIRVEDNRLVFTNPSQQDVGISTKVPTWGWEIRRNRIEGAGTGLYLGNSDGSQPFVAGVIEHNLVMNTVGYNLQVKQQNPWPAGTGLPTDATRTVIRHNVFIKDDRPSPDGDRPNLLVDGFPDTGDGANNGYEVYGNLFFENPREALFQATGNVSIHDNLFIKSTGPALVLTDHAGKQLKTAYVYNNTIVTPGTAIAFYSAARVADLVTGNVLLAGTPTSGTIAHAVENVTDTFANAAQYVQSPTLQLPGLDLYPRPGKVQGPALDLSAVMADLGGGVDFNGVSKGAFLFRGAYAGEGANPGWLAAVEIKPNVASAGGGAGGGGGDGDAGTGGGTGGGAGGGGDNTGGGVGGGAGEPSSGCGCDATSSGLTALLGLALLGTRARRRSSQR